MLGTSRKHLSVTCWTARKRMRDSSHVFLDRFISSIFLEKQYIRTCLLVVLETFWEVMTVYWFFVCSLFVPPFCFLSKINFIVLFSSSRFSIFALSTFVFDRHFICVCL